MDDKYHLVSDPSFFPAFLQKTNKKLEKNIEDLKSKAQKGLNEGGLRNWRGNGIKILDLRRGKTNISIQ